MNLRHKNIVIIYMLYFGDMVSLSPFLEILRREAVGSKITLVIDARFQEAVRYNPCIDTIIPVDRKKMGLSATWKLGKEIGKTHPDILMVLHGTTRTFLMAMAMKAKVWVGETGNPLGRFFIDDEILVERRDCHAAEKYVKVLSGGERSRLAMIKLLLEPVNLLILDEPTNHLDMQSKDVFKEAIKAFDGTAIIVSHDREFLDGLVDKVYEFAGGKVREHLGGIYDYLRAHNAESISQALANQGVSQNMSSAGSPSSSSSSADSSEASSGKLSYAEHKEQQKKIRKAEKAVKECETKIEKLETRKAEIDALLMKPENATNMELVTEYTELMKSLDEENENWMMLSEELEEVKNS